MATIRQAQLINRQEQVIYMKDGAVCETPASEMEKLAHSIFGETKIMKTETIIEHWRIKTQKEATEKFWNWIEENKADSRDYYLVFTE